MNFVFISTNNSLTVYTEEKYSETIIKISTTGGCVIYCMPKIGLSFQHAYYGVKIWLSDYR